MKKVIREDEVKRFTDWLCSKFEIKPLTLEFIDSLDMIDGEFDAEGRKIIIQRKLLKSRKDLLDTIVHEFLHALFLDMVVERFSGDVDEVKNLEERIINVISPQLWKWLWKMFEKETRFISRDGENTGGVK